MADWMRIRLNLQYHWKVPLLWGLIIRATLLALMGIVFCSTPVAASGARERPHAVPVLTYHPSSLSGSTYATSDFIAFREDLRLLDRLGFQIIPLSWVVEWVLEGRPIPARAVALTLDDGADSTYLETPAPDAGPRQSFVQALQEFQVEVGRGRQPHLHVTVFVIASPRARAEINPHITDLHDTWWRAAQASPLVDIGNHSWDHNHPDVQVRCAETSPRQHGFRAIDTYAEAGCAVALAAASIHRIIGQWPTLFAYPYGESSAYLRDVYFPQFPEQHRTWAAFGIGSRPITKGSSRWNLPRYGYRLDWQTPMELQQLLRRITQQTDKPA